MKEELPDPGRRLLPPLSSVAGLPGQLLQRGLLSAPQQPGQLASLDQYQVLSVLGEGGMGIVLRALDSQSGTIVAIKLLKPELANQPQMVHRFLKEARHLQQLKHLNILPALYVSENPARPYFVMPIVEHGSLIRKLSEDSPMAEEECVAIARQVAAALAHAHAKGVIHRDLKPGNVLVDFFGTAYLADFGLARTVFNDSLMDAAKGETGEGTAHYMSPQLARGEAEDTWCDIYALGALLYEMLTGRPPYEGQSTSQILQQIRTSPPEPILNSRPKLSPWLLKVVEGAMAREHRDRYANMADVLADLERLEKRQPVLEPHRAISLRRLLKGRALPVAGITIGILLLAFGVLGSLWLPAGFSLRVLHEFRNDKVLNWATAQTGDWDGDGESDIIHVSDGNLYVVTSRGQQQAPLTITKPHANGLVLGMMADINGDGRDEALVSWSSGTNAYLTAFNQRTWPVKEFVFAGSLNVHPQWGANFTRLRPLRLADLDGDGQRELLASVTSTWALRPRGICCFEVETGQLKWFFETATFVTTIDLCDLDGDGRQEVVVGSNSPGNGCKLADETDDAHAYVYVLSSKGELRWRRELAGIYANVKPLNPAHGQTNVMVWVTAIHAYNLERGEPDTGKVLEFNAEGEVVHAHDFGVQLTSSLVVDLDSDGRHEVLAADRLGVLHVLDGRLIERRRITNATPRFDEVELQLALAANLTAAGAPQVVLASSQLERRSEPAPGNNREKFETIFHHENRVVVLDSALNQIATSQLAQKWTEFPGIKAGLLFNGPGKLPSLAVLTDKVQILDLTRIRRPLFSRNEGVNEK
ncbi:MAG: protein kinase [Verrucomicrobia bacterium]|nr:protein kinase [Verrucomicrobiota bacterium]